MHVALVTGRTAGIAAVVAAGRQHDAVFRSHAVEGRVATRWSAEV